jgi:V-type H+-transporting ATPase subunit a
MYACVTFPFLFGVMFGDMGHGGLLLLTAIFICLFSNQIKKASPEVAKMVLPLRYMFLLMGFFAFFCGLMYNDFMSIPLNLFGSCYDFQTGKFLDENRNCVYPVGIDPIWYQSKQEITFANSLKMKISVIFGVAHMSLGIFQKANNAIHFGHWLDFWHEFVPQIVMLLALFGYMDLLVIIKWCTDYHGMTHEAPAIITTMVGMFLSGGTVVGKELFPGQQFVSLLLLGKF